MPTWRQEHLDQLRSQGLGSADTLANFASMRSDMMHPDIKKAVQLLNRRGKLRQIHLDMRPSQSLEYIKLCTEIPGFENSEIVFASPTRWSVIPSTKWKKRSWFLAFLMDTIDKSLHGKPPYADWGEDEKYRVQVDIFPALPEGRTAVMASMDSSRIVDLKTGDDSGVDTVMEGLSLS